MKSEDIKMQIGKKVLDPELLRTFLARPDDYGEDLLKKTLKKLEYVFELASTFNFDLSVASAIMIFSDFATLCCEEQSEAFLRKVSPTYLKSSHATSITEKVLEDLDEDSINRISNGVASIINGKHVTPEEQIVDIVNYGYKFIDTIEDPRNRTVVMSNYINEVIRRSIEQKALTAVAIPPNKIKTRNKVIRLDDILLEKNYKEYIDNHSQIPLKYKESFSASTPMKEIVAYYVVTSDERHFIKENQPPKSGVFDFELDE